MSVYNKNCPDFRLRQRASKQNIYYNKESSPSRLCLLLGNVYHMFLGLRRSCPVILQKRRRKHYYLPPLTLAIDLFHSVAAWMADCWLFDLLRNKEQVDSSDRFLPTDPSRSIERPAAPVRDTVDSYVMVYLVSESYCS